MRSLCLALVLLSLPVAASAQSPAGAATIGGSFWTDGSYGVNGLVDVLAPVGPLRLGGAVGLYAVAGGSSPSANNLRSQLLTPFALSAALIVGDPAAIGFELRARVGGWVGATDQSGFTGGFYADGSALVRIGIGGRGAVVVGLDLWGSVSPNTRDGGLLSGVSIGPVVGITWSPPEPVAPAVE